MSDAKDVHTKPDAGVDSKMPGGLALNAPPFVPRNSQEQRSGLRLSSIVNAAPFVPASQNSANPNDGGTTRPGEKSVCKQAIVSRTPY